MQIVWNPADQAEETSVVSRSKCYTAHNLLGNSSEGIKGYLGILSDFFATCLIV